MALADLGPWPGLHDPYASVSAIEGPPLRLGTPLSIRVRISDEWEIDDGRILSLLRRSKTAWPHGTGQSTRRHSAIPSGPCQARLGQERALAHTAGSQAPVVASSDGRALGDPGWNTSAPRIPPPYVMDWTLVSACHDRRGSHSAGGRPRRVLGHSRRPRTGASWPW